MSYYAQLLLWRNFFAKGIKFMKFGICFAEGRLAVLNDLYLRKRRVIEFSVPPCVRAGFPDNPPRIGHGIWAGA